MEDTMLIEDNGFIAKINLQNQMNDGHIKLSEKAQKVFDSSEEKVIFALSLESHSPWKIEDLEVVQDGDFVNFVQEKFKSEGHSLQEIGEEFKKL